VVMIVVPLSPIFYLLMNSPNKAVGKTKWPLSLKK
jgi:hypothetical protein